MTAETADTRRTTKTSRHEIMHSRIRNPRHTFTVGEQLLAKLGPDKFSALEGRLAARTRKPRRGGKGRS